MEAVREARLERSGSRRRSRRAAGALVAGLMAAGMAPVAAEPGTPYIGVDVSQWRYDASGFDAVSDAGVRMRLGIEGYGNFALEAHFHSPGDATEDDLTVEFDTIAGLHLIGHYTVAPRFRVLVLTGLSRHDVDREVGAGTISEDDDDFGFSFGLGLGLGVTERVAARVDYMNYTGNLETFNAGLTYRF